MYQNRNNSRIKANLGIGPMSSETIEAVFKYSNSYKKELMLIASKNQIDYNQGYVNNWTTKKYYDFVKEMRKKYPDGQVKICRDHCGPGFNGKYGIEDTYSTIRADIENGFNLIHIDFCHLIGSQEEKLKESKMAVEYALKLNPNIALEIGTDDNLGIEFELNHLKTLEREVDFFLDFCSPEFYVVQTGSLIKEINQIGRFNKSFIKEANELLKSRGIKLKEHNADYLSKEEIIQRRGLVDAMNIAPQLGVIQTLLVLTKCLSYGIRTDNFIEETYNEEKWKKWMHKNSPENKFLCEIIAGHYHFASEKYKNIISELEKRENIHETIIDNIMEVIKHYEN